MKRMRKDIEKLYDLFYSSILTPHNLLDNIELGNYRYIKYYQENNKTIAEIECEVEGEFVVFYYKFDQKNRLDSVFMGENKKLVYDRELEKQYQLAEVVQNQIEIKNSLNKAQ
jgi:hypothetical protein